MEQKSERVQFLLTQIFSNLIKTGDNYLIETPSFIVQYHNLNSSNLFNQITQKENTLILPSYCNLANDDNNFNNNNNDNIIILKVYLFFLEKNRLNRLKLIFFLILANFNSDGY